MAPTEEMQQLETLDAKNQNQQIEKPKKKRVWEIDFIRGVAILGMVVDHGIWDLANLQSFFSNFYKVNIDWVNQMTFVLSNWYQNGRQYFHNLAFLFFIITGISSTFSKNNWKHSLKIFLASLILFVFTYGIYHITYALDPNGAFDFRICFGVLYALSVGCLVVSLIPTICIQIEKLIQNIKAKCAERKNVAYEKKEIKSAPKYVKWIYLGLGIALICGWIIVTYTINYPNKGLKFNNFSTFWYYFIRMNDSAPYLTLVGPSETTDFWAKIFGVNFGDWCLSALGFKSLGSDYFSLMPWVGWTLIGAFLGKTIYAKKESLLPKLDGKWNKPFAYAGNKSLWIYIFHQPFWIVILAIVFLPMGYRFF